MAIKYFCDVCGKETDRLWRFWTGVRIGSSDMTYSAHLKVCKGCAGEPIGDVKQPLLKVLHKEMKRFLQEYRPNNEGEDGCKAATDKTQDLTERSSD